MAYSWKKCWPWIKALLWLGVFAAVAWQFFRILENEGLRDPEGKRPAGEILLEQLASTSISGVLLCGLLYLVGIGFSAWYFHDLLKEARTPLGFPFALRCYYTSQLGKYVPGKGMALFLRITSSMQGGVPAAIGAVVTVYEVLVTMAAGACLAVLSGLFLPQARQEHLAGAVFLLAVSLGPVLPWIFPRLVRVLAGRFLSKNQRDFIPISISILVKGLVITGIGWCILGGSLLALWQGMDASSAWTWQRLGWCVGVVTLAGVSGFVASTPGGLGVREILIQAMLAGSLGARAVTAAILLRLVWTVAEVVAAAIFFWIPPSLPAKNNSAVVGDTTQSTQGTP
ncbi:MAG: flippase-like domain-containing protein [Gemmataceae bacterium]|nr:flippase-like domain-containing protein [Gemmataceae bacterium]